MSKYLLILTTAAAIGASYLFSQSVLPARMAETERTTDAINEMLADQLAASGLNEAAEWLEGRITMPTAQEFVGRFSNDHMYVATIQPNGQPNQVVVRARGIIPGTSGDVERVREVVYELGAGGSSESSESGGQTGVLPIFMQSAIFAGSLAGMNGTRVNAAIPTANANVQTNSGSTGLNGNTVRGYYYYNSPNLNQLSWLRPQFQPNSNPNSESTVQHREPVVIPPFNAQSFRNLPGVNVRPQNQQNVNGGTFDLGGSPGNPTIWYFPQGLNINGATFKGYAVLITPEWFNINGIHGVGDSQFTMFARGYNINGSINLPLYLFSNESMSVNHLTMTGSIVARNHLNINGSVINHQPPPTDLVSPVFEVEEVDSPGELKFRAISYRSW